MAVIRVSDTGAGMDQATLDRVFEPFFSTKPMGRGTGLGLATIYGIVTGADGSIDIYSELRLGTTVNVLLPATDERAEPDAASPLPAGEDMSGHGEAILLVEDEPSLRELTSRILTRNGYQVCVAADGANALRRVEDPARPLHLLLTAWSCPRCSATSSPPASPRSARRLPPCSSPGIPSRSWTHTAFARRTATSRTSRSPKQPC